MKNIDKNNFVIDDVFNIIDKKNKKNKASKSEKNKESESNDETYVITI